MAINVGAFLAPLVCGTLGELYGWHYGFGAAGVGMLVGIAIYLQGRDYLPADNVRRAGRARQAAVRRRTHDRGFAGRARDHGIVLDRADPGLEHLSAVDSRSRRS